MFRTYRGIKTYIAAKKAGVALFSLPVEQFSPALGHCSGKQRAASCYSSSSPSRYLSRAARVPAYIPQSRYFEDVPRATLCFTGLPSPSNSSTIQSGHISRELDRLGASTLRTHNRLLRAPGNLDVFIFGGGDSGVASPPTVLPNSRQKSAGKKSFQETVPTPRDTRLRPSRRRKKKKSNA